MRGLKITYSGNQFYTVIDLQTGARARIARNYAANTDNGHTYAAHTFMALHRLTGQIHFIGNDNNSKYYAIDESAF